MLGPEEMQSFYQQVELFQNAEMLDNPMLGIPIQLTHQDQDYGFFHELFKDGLLEQFAQRKLHAEALNQKKNPFYPYPKGTDFKGNIPLGFINSRKEIFRAEIRDFVHNLLTVGSAGTGKSRLIVHSAQFLFPFAHLSFFDRKREYRVLTRLLEKRIHVIKANQIAFNPLEVQTGDDILGNLHATANNFCADNYLLSFSKNIFIEEAKNLYQSFDVFKGTNRSFPTLKDLLKRLQQRKGSGFRESEAISSLTNRLRTYIDLGICNYSKGFNIHTLFNSNAIIELDGYTSEVYRTIPSYWILQIHRWRMRKNLRDHLLPKPNLIICDEARLLFPNLSQADPAFGQSSILDLYTTGREFGLHWILLTQEPSSLSPTILSNTGIQVMFPLSSGYERQKMAQGMGLSKEMIDYLPKLPPTRVAVVKTFSYPTPFLMMVPEFQLVKNVSDDDLDTEANQNFIRSLGAEPAKDELIEIKTSDELSALASHFLFVVSKNNFSPLTELYKKADLTSYNGKKAKDELIGKDYCKEESLILGKGRPLTFLSLQDKAYSFLKKNPAKGTKGGFIHNLLASKIAQFYQKQGWKVSLEKDQVDIRAEKLGEPLTAIEITLALSNLQENIERDLGLGYERIVLVFRDKESLEQARQKLQGSLDKSWASLQDRISLEMIEKYWG